MYQVRRLSTRLSRLLEVVYGVCNPVILKVMQWFFRLNSARLNRVIEFVERQVKGFMFDCKMCGDCVLSKTGMTCPMNCPKQMRNGPCGGVRVNGNCEVSPKMRCVWVEAYQGAARMKNGDLIQEFRISADQETKDQSAWLSLVQKKELQ